MKSFRFFIIFLLILSFTTFSCRGKSTNSLVGRWKEVGNTVNPEDIEFFRDGTLNFYIEEGVATGTYKFLDSSRIQISELAGTRIFKYTVLGNTLFLTNEQTGEKIQLQRIK